MYGTCRIFQAEFIPYRRYTVYFLYEQSKIKVLNGCESCPKRGDCRSEHTTTELEGCHPGDASAFSTTAVKL